MNKKLLLMVMVIFSLMLLSSCGLITELNDKPTTQPNTEDTVSATPTAEPNYTDYYVSINGDDANPGTMERPWKTFHKAVNEVKPGQTVYVMEGTYTERLIIQKSGMYDAPITFMAYPGDIVTIDGADINMPSWAGLIHISELIYINISGFRVINSPAMGIFACDSNHITIENNYIYNTFAPGIHAWGDNNLIIDNNTLEWTCNEKNAPLECLSLRRTNHFQISNNHVFNSGAIGIDSAESFMNGKIYNNEVHDTGLGIYLDGWDQHGSNVEVYDNICYNNRTGFAVNAENGGIVDHIELRNNVAYDNEADGYTICWGGVFESTHTVSNLTLSSNRSYNNGGSGFSILGVNKGLVDNVMLVNNLSYNNKKAGFTVSGVAKEPLTYSIKNIRIINNTIYNNGSDTVWGSGGIFISNPETSTGEMENIIIRNNIVSSNENFSIALWRYGTAPHNAIIENNLFEGYLYDVHDYGETLGDDYIKGNPLFFDYEKNDFHLSADSDAIDHGTSASAPLEDYEGTNRPQGDGIDIGAYEFN